MSILSRLKRIEANNPNKPACFCGKTLVDLWYGDTDADSLTYCPKCKPQFDHWKRIAAEAGNGENLTDEIKE